MSNGTTGTDGYDYSGISSESVDAQIDDVAGGNDTLSSLISGIFGGIVDNIGTIGSAAGGMAAINSAYNRLGAIGDQALLGASEIAKGGLAQSKFQPFTVTTGTGGNVTVDEFGSVDLSSGQGGLEGTLLGEASRRFSQAPVGTSTFADFGNQALGVGGGQLGMAPALSPEVQAASQALLSRGQSDLGRSAFGLSGQETAARQAFGLGGQFMGRAGAGTSAREQDVFNRIRAMQTPEEQRQRLALEERLANQGRLGVRTNMFGGTPEQFALAKAQEEAQNQAALMAMQQAQQEQRQQAAIGAQFAGLGSNIANQRQALESAQQLQALRALTSGTDVAAKDQAMQDAQQLSALRALQTGQGLINDRMALQRAQQQLGLGALTGAFIPQAQTLNALQQGLASSQLAQRGQLYGAGLFGEASMGGLEALLGAGLGQANLMGNVGTGLLSGAMQGSGGGQDGFGAIINAAGSAVGDLVGQGVKALGNAFGISDIRLKDNIKYLTTNPKGFNIYSWDWNKDANKLGEHGFGVGVIAQDLFDNHADHVVLGKDGYYRVDYQGIWR